MNCSPKAILGYLAGLTVSQGRLAGRPFRVLPWQARFVRGAFRPGVQSASITLGRGSGKTALLSAVACAHLDGPAAVPRGEVVIVASSFEQARIAFEHSVAFMGDKLRDRKRWRVWDTAQMSRIECRLTGARIRCIGSDPRRAHGLAPTLILADEGAQWPSATGERMIAALMTAAGKQPFCRFVAIGTRPDNESHWFAQALAGNSDYSQVHAAHEDDKPFHKRTWVKANPSLPHMPDLEAAIRREAKLARRDEAALQSFKALRLNLGTSDVRISVLVEAETWKACIGDAPREGWPILGWDFGTSAAMSACAAYWPTGRLEVLASFPRQPGLAERGALDGVGGLYQRMADRGELVLTGERAVSLSEFVELAIERFGLPSEMVLDRWRLAEALDVFDAIGLPVCPVIPRGQGYRDGGEDVRQFRRAVLSGKVIPVKSLLLTSAMSEARTVSDPSGNSKLAKGSEGDRRARARDDSAAAAVLAVACGVRRASEPQYSPPQRVIV